MKLLAFFLSGIVISFSQPIYVSSEFTEKEITTEDQKTFSIGDTIVLGSPIENLGDKYKHITDSIGNPHPYNFQKTTGKKYVIVALRKDEAIKIQANGKEWFFIWNKANEDGEVQQIKRI